MKSFLYDLPASPVLIIGPPVPYCKAEDSCKWRNYEEKSFGDHSVNAVSSSLPNIAQVSSWKRIEPTEQAVMAALVSTGPLSVVMDASLLPFYHSGVWRGRFCHPNQTDHAVLLIGYGSTKTVFGKELKYWIIQNSWGEKWGEKGYFRLERGVNDSKHPFGACNILVHVTTAEISSTGL